MKTGRPWSKALVSPQQLSPKIAHLAEFDLAVSFSFTAKSWTAETTGFQRSSAFAQPLKSARLTGARSEVAVDIKNHHRLSSNRKVCRSQTTDDPLEFFHTGDSDQH